VVKDAVNLATAGEEPDALFNRAQSLATPRWKWRHEDKGLLTRVPTELRLALEMVTHEESERRALEGELDVLEAAWKEAEEIASISDNLFLPPEIESRISKLKAKR
jgi:hypothetical protein